MRRKLLSPSILLFVVTVAAVALWIGGGVLTREPPQLSPAEERGPPLVAASWSDAQAVERLLTLYGDVQPHQVVRVRAQTAGQIVEILVASGTLVTTGDELARLAMEDRMARLRRAEARVATTERNYEATRRLAERNVAPQAQVEATLAELEAARAEREAIRIEIENTLIRAPIEGVINRLLAERGDYVSVGGDIVEIVDNDPLRAIVHVPQHAVGRVAVGQPAQVSLIGDEPIAGTVRFVAPVADAATRTFGAEIEVPNPERSLPSGISAEVVIPTETVMAHKVSPALVGLDDQGRTGIHAVDQDGVVVFHPIRLVRAERDGIWVSGLPERARLITIRPGFVTEGQQVVVRETPPGYGPVGAAAD